MSAIANQCGKPRAVAPNMLPGLVGLPLALLLMDEVRTALEVFADSRLIEQGDSCDRGATF
jgi:hypothetical protein